MRPDQARLNSVLIDSISMMCQKGLTGYKELTIKGVIAVTIDHHDTFVVHVNKTFDPTTILENSLSIKSENQQSGNISSTTIKSEFKPNGSFNNRNNFSPQQKMNPNFMGQPQNRFIRPPGTQQNSPYKNMAPQQMQAHAHNSLVPVRAQRPRMKMQSPNQQSPNQNSFMPRQNMAMARMPSPNMTRGSPRGGRGIMRARGRGTMVLRGGRGGGALASVRGKAKPVGVSGTVTQPKNDSSFKLVSRYMCGISECNAAFVSLSNLRRHQKSKHGGYQGGDGDGYGDDYDDDGEEEEENGSFEYGGGMDYMV